MSRLASQHTIVDIGNAKVELRRILLDCLQYAFHYPVEA